MTNNEVHSKTHDSLTVADVAMVARTIYATAPARIKYKQMLRPYICPFHILIDYVPRGATILDVGCGSGLFISLLTSLYRVQSAVGFDADGAAIQAAQAVAAKLPNYSRIRFEHRNAHKSWPEGRFDVVSLIDVMHHVRPEQQAELIATAAEHVDEGGNPHLQRYGQSSSLARMGKSVSRFVVGPGMDFLCESGGRH